ncbi:MAG: DUF4363 family protein [Oscillospiraceae bacterium]
MKKEIAAAGLLLLLIAGALVNIGYLRGFVGELGDNLALSRSAMENGDAENAELMLRSAIDEWLSADGYTHIFIRHSEIDLTTDAFYELLSDILAGDSQSAIGSFEKLEAHLASLVTMERVTLGSIF